MKTILVISYSNLATDPRVNRQIRWLSESYQVIAAGLADPGVPGVRFIALNHVPPKKSLFARGKSALQILARRFESHYWWLPATLKGLEALVIESYTTARAYGVEDHVLPTLAETFPSIDWDQTGAYFFSRVVQHGQRRAEEMRECAATVQEAGFAPIMAGAIASKQQWVADQAKAGVFAGVAKGAPWQDYADALLKARTGNTPDA